MGHHRGYLLWEEKPSYRHFGRDCHIYEEFDAVEKLSRM